MNNPTCFLCAELGAVQGQADDAGRRLADDARYSLLRAGARAQSVLPGCRLGVLQVPVYG